MAKQVDKNILIGDLVQIDPGIIAILMSAGMHCVGCPSSAGETLEEASMVHGMDVNKLVDAITDFLSKQ